MASTIVYLDMVNAKYELVTQGRNLRRAGNISASKRVKFIYKPVNFTPPHDLEVIKLLLNAEALEVNADYQAPKGTPTARTELGELCPAAGRSCGCGRRKVRLTKERERIEGDIAKTGRSSRTRTSFKKFRRRCWPSISSGQLI